MITKNFSFFILLIFSVLALGFLIIYWSVTRPFCTNTLSCKESLTLKIENDAIGVFNGRKIIPPKVEADYRNTSKHVLGEETSVSEKHIYVNLTNQSLTAYDGGKLFMQANISSGKWHPTPTGEFTIWEKIRATRMTGGTGADFYDLPNVPYVMFFQGDGAPASAGFGLHGAYWHNNFGHPMSHGCINMRQIDAQKLYDWVGETQNVKITIHGQAPI